MREEYAGSGPTSTSSGMGGGRGGEGEGEERGWLERREVVVEGPGGGPRRAAV